MRDGFVKVAAATPEVRVADCAYNAQSILALAKEAEGQGVQLLVLPELCLTAYTCGDLFFQPVLLEGAVEALNVVAEGMAGSDMLLVLGLPVAVSGKIFNCAAVLQRGEVLGLVPKTYLPNYGEFYERRQFEPAAPGASAAEVSALGRSGIPFGSKLLFRCQDMAAFTLGVEICEDLWTPAPPSIGQAVAGATVIANLSASDETVGKEDYRRELVLGQSARLLCGYVYADAGYGESTTDMVFAAHNIVGENGGMLAEGQRFQNNMIVTEIDVNKLLHERRRLTTFPGEDGEGYRVIEFSQKMRRHILTRRFAPRPFVPENPASREQRCESILQIQSQGLAKRIAHVGSKAAVIGASGGLDSTLALLVAARTMDFLKRPRQDILAVTMPAFGTTKRTRGNAEKTSEALGATLLTVDISEAVRVHFRDIGQPEDLHDVTYENAQARERTQVLMDLANQRNGLVVGTGDLSELALGWATYNGDHMSMYAVNASVPKTLVRYLVAYEAERTEDEALRAVLLDVLDTPVSPELLPPTSGGEIAQRTEDLVGPYELHDFFLYHGIRWGFPPRKVYRLACAAFEGVFEGTVIAGWMETFYRRFFAQQFKRSCLPDGPKVGSVALSPRGDWRMPSDGVSKLWLEEIAKIRESGGA